MKATYDLEHVIVVRRRLYDGVPSVWDFECTVDGVLISEGTAPTFYGCVDSAIETIQDNNSATYDANKNCGERGVI